MRLSDIDLAEVESWIAAMRRKSGATSVIRAYGVLAGILDDAVKARRLRANPARGVENLPRKTAKRRVYLTADDVGQLADESGEHRAMVLTLAFTGVRWGEAVALRVRDVEFLRRRLNVHDNAVQLGVDHAEGANQKSPLLGRCPSLSSSSTNSRCNARAGAMTDLVFGDGEHYQPRPKSTGRLVRRGGEARQGSK